MLARPHPSGDHAFLVGVRATCTARGLLAPTDRVLAAVSGGPDSTALLLALAELRDAGLLAELAAAHVDHQLRAGSAADGDFCAELCARLRVPLDRMAVTVEAGNVQAQARRARYAALRRAAERFGASRIATGHTRSDQAETVLLRLLRGAGARGLAAIPPRRGIFIRPLIDRTRSEVLAFLSDRGSAFRVDPTNSSPRYLRNRVRASLLPLLRELNPAVERALARTADLCREDERALDRLARTAMEEGEAGVRLDRLERAPLAVQRRMIRRLWRRAAGTRKELELLHVEALLGLARRTGPGRVALPRGLEGRCAYGTLTIAPPGALEPANPFEIEVGRPGLYAVPGRALQLAISWAPGARGTGAGPLRLRTRRPGDRFRPANGRGSKSLKRWLIDRKVPRERRDGLVLLTDLGGEVLWIPELAARSARLAGIEVEVVRES